MNKNHSFLIAIVFFVSWWYFAKTSPVIALKKVHIFYTYSALIVFAGLSTHLALKYKQPQYVTYGLNGSCAFPPYEKGEYNLFRLGGIHFLNEKGSEAFICEHKALTRKHYRGYSSIGRPIPCELDDLPLEVKSYVIDKGIKPPYYQSLIVDKQEGSNENIKLYKIIEQKNNTINALIQENDIRGKIIQSFIHKSANAVISLSPSKPSLRDKVKKMITKDD